MTTKTHHSPRFASHIGQEIYKARVPHGISAGRRMQVVFARWDQLTQTAAPNAVDEVCLLRTLANVHPSRMEVFHERRRLFALERDIVDRIDETCARHRASLAWSLGQLRISPHDETWALARSVEGDIETHKLSKIVRLAKGFSGLGFMDRPLYEALLERAIELRKETEDHQMAMLLYSFASLYPDLARRYAVAMMGRIVNFTGKSRWLVPIWEALASFGWELPPTLHARFVSEVGFGSFETSLARRQFPDIEAGLKELGLAFKKQETVGPYFVDFAIEIGDRKVAVIVGSERNWYVTGPHKRAVGPVRLQYANLSQLGWEQCLLSFADWERASDQKAFLEYTLQLR